MRATCPAAAALLAVVGLAGCPNEDVPFCEEHPGHASCADAGEDAGGADAGPADAGGPDTGVGDDGGALDAGADDAGGPDGGPCGGPCGGSTPVCDAARGACVECTGDGHCTGEERCDTTSGTCVTCLEHADCPDPSASRCEAGACVPCAASAQCAHLSGLGVCDGGECVECTPSEAAACGASPCRTDRTCSGYGTGTEETCERCDADDNCQGPHDYCVPMTHAGTSRGGYCLTDRDAAGGCEQPYSITLDGRTTLSGRAGGRYCGIHEELASCEAVRALLENWRCTGTDGRCSPAAGEPELDVPGALCRTVGGLANRCTYGCSLAAHCAESPPSNTCGPGTTGGDDYCGG